MALIAAQQARLKAEQEKLEREAALQREQTEPTTASKKAGSSRNFSSMSVRPSKKAMNPSPKGSPSEEESKDSEELVTPGPFMSPETRQQKNGEPEKMHILLDSTPQDFDKYESEFKVLDETELNNDSVLEDPEEQSIIQENTVEEKSPSPFKKSSEEIQEESDSEEKKSSSDAISFDDLDDTAR